MEFSIGTRLKELRKTKRLSITELAEKSGVSTGLISQIERNLVVPSVVNLYRIAQALGTDINYFFESSESRTATITRRGEHKMMITDQGHGIYELFTSSRLGHILDLVRVTLRGGESYSHEMVTHEGGGVRLCPQGHADPSAGRQGVSPQRGGQHLFPQHHPPQVPEQR